MKGKDFKNYILNEKNVLITEKFINNIFSNYKINHKIKDLGTFQKSMTHKSYLENQIINERTSKELAEIEPIKTTENVIPLQLESYERLEYLGDAMIHVFLAQYLFLRYEKEDQGFLTVTRIKLEKGHTLSTLSRKLGFAKYAVISRNLENMETREKNDHIMEDLMESFIGAMSLEMSFQKCKSFFINLIESEIDMAELINTNDNYKDILMRHFQKLKWAVPQYIELKTDTENRIFIVVVKNPDGKIIGRGEGSTKAQSTQMAAHNALITLGVIEQSTKSESKDDYF